MNNLFIPEFSTISDFLEIHKLNKVPIKVALFGTLWSPPCRYTFQALKDSFEEIEQKELMEIFYINQDSELQFCFRENIPIGFPTIIVFHQNGIFNFVSHDYSIISNKIEKKIRLIKQLNKKQLTSILQQSLDSILKKKKKFIIIPE